MREELVRQYNHAWKMFHKMVEDFDDDSWLTAGCGYIRPARIAYHIIGGVNYYIEEQSPVALVSGKRNDWNWELGRPEDLPTRDDIRDLIHVYKKKTDRWINSIDLEAPNTTFSWAGPSTLSVVLFLLRHMEYHIGELNLLLHLSNGGKANDNWVRALEEFQV